jgi:cytochrome c-type biogenesis protein CcmH
MKRCKGTARWALALLFTVVLVSVQAETALDARLKALEEELRCLVCQNQTLADSSAPLAEDLRREVRELALQGKSDAEIKDYLVARYGDFVLYKPPVKSTTYLLWFGPFAFLIGGALVWLVVLRRRRGRNQSDRPATEGPATTGQNDRARQLLVDPLDT